MSQPQNATFIFRKTETPIDGENYKLELQACYQDAAGTLRDGPKFSREKVPITALKDPLKGYEIKGHDGYYQVPYEEKEGAYQLPIIWELNNKTRRPLMLCKSCLKIEHGGNWHEHKRTDKCAHEGNKRRRVDEEAQQRTQFEPQSVPQHALQLEPQPQQQHVLQLEPHSALQPEPQLQQQHALQLEPHSALQPTLQHTPEMTLQPQHQSTQHHALLPQPIPASGMSIEEEVEQLSQEIAAAPLLDTHSPSMWLHHPRVTISYISGRTLQHTRATGYRTTWEKLKELCGRDGTPLDGNTAKEKHTGNEFKMHNCAYYKRTSEQGPELFALGFTELNAMRVCYHEEDEDQWYVYGTASIIWSADK